MVSSPPELLEPATKLLSSVFTDDPVLKYLLCSLSEQKRLAYLPAYFHSLLTAAALNGGRFDEANGWHSCAVWMPPGTRVDSPMTWIPAGMFTILWTIGLQGCRRMLWEFVRKADAAKAVGLKGQKKYHYLFFIGTDLNHRGEGLASALIKKYQAIAAAERLPIWLEATTTDSAKVYAKLGFDTIQEITLGKGAVGPDGSKLKGGEGVKVWAMLWTPSPQQAL